MAKVTSGARQDRYDFRAVEEKWRQRWEAEGLYTVREDPGRPKFYALTMYPYPSGDLHIGHWYALTPSDARARWLRMRGYNVLFPMGFDAFGLPAENAAIKYGVHPHEWTMRNIERMRRQLRTMGTMIDWGREVVTCDPEYYKWNQWFFLRLFERGLAYKKRAAVDWCPSCNTTLAREQVWGEDRHCERCDTPVVKKELDQWFFRITAYAEELLDFSRIEWPERVVAMQRNWIGRSEGVQFRFEVADHPGTSFEVFTTRIDTVFGASFVVLAPEHPLVPTITTPAQRAAVEAYQYQASRESEIERLSTERERTGVFTGAYAIHPLSGERIPIWIGDYVLATYGTGAIMAVPAHDERDFDFARRYGLPIPVVVAPPGWQGEALTAAYEGPGTLVRSGPFDGLPNEEAKVRLAEELERRGIGRRTVQYRLRDWLISRQRYWGTPIPIIYCPACGIVPVPDEDLPVLLPMDVDFTPTGESPLLRHEGFRRTTCPRCGGPAERETDTMDTFVDSSWYQYRYLSPHDDRRPFDPEKAAYWLPVDQYTGGVEHATMHLLYTRFFTKAMRDMGLVDFDEPMLRLFNQGIILGEDGHRMSKSRGNVVAPDDLVERHGADAVRVFLMFIGPWEAGGPWSSQGIEGAVRFLNRAWRYVGEAAAAPDTPPPEPLERLLHDTVRRVGHDLEGFRFNTAIAALMELLNAAAATPNRTVARTFTLLLAPFAPHLAEELWAMLGGRESVHLQPWPTYDPARLAAETVTVVVQVNGRVRDRLEVPRGLGEAEVTARALEREKVRQAVPPSGPKKVVYVPDKILNFVV